MFNYTQDQIIVICFENCRCHIFLALKLGSVWIGPSTNQCVICCNGFGYFSNGRAHPRAPPSITIIIIISNYKCLSNDAIIISSSSFKRTESLASDSDSDLEFWIGHFYLDSLGFLFRSVLFCSVFLFSGLVSFHSFAERNTKLNAQ